MKTLNNFFIIITLFLFFTFHDNIFTKNLKLTSKTVADNESKSNSTAFDCEEVNSTLESIDKINEHVGNLTSNIQQHAQMYKNWELKATNEGDRRRLRKQQFNVIDEYSKNANEIQDIISILKNTVTNLKTNQCERSNEAGKSLDQADSASKNLTYFIEREHIQLLNKNK